MIPLKKFNETVYYVEGSLKKIGADEIAFLKAQILDHDLDRIRICTHLNVTSDIHEMIIVLRDKTYIQPHRHNNKIESFHLIEGSALVVLFNDTGDILDVYDLLKDKDFYYRIDNPTYHTQIITSDFLVFHEVTRGPFLKEDSNGAPWAPQESELERGHEYITELREKALTFLSKNNL